MGRTTGEQIVVIGVVIKDMPPQRGHIAGGGHMAFLGQAMGVLEGGAAHPQRFGGAVHPAGKGRLGPRNRFADGGCRIIGGFHSRRTDQVAQFDALTGHQPQFGRRFRRCL